MYLPSVYGLVANITQWCNGINPLDIDAMQESAMADSTLLDPKGGLTSKAQASVAFGLAMFPTVFNACNLMIMIWFTKLYVKIVCWIMPAKNKDMEEEFSLKYIGRGMLSASELNITQAQKEIVVYGERVSRMLKMAKDILHLPEKDSAYSETYNRLEKYEEISDRMEIEIGNYLNHRVGRTSQPRRQNAYSRHATRGERDRINRRWMLQRGKDGGSPASEPCQVHSGSVQ